MLLEKIKSFIKKIKHRFSYNACYNAMEQRGIAVFGMCSGVAGGDVNSGQLSCQCMDCPYLTLTDKE